MGFSQNCEEEDEGISGFDEGDFSEVREDLAKELIRCPGEGLISALECADRRAHVMPFFNPPNHPKFDRNGEFKTYAKCLECAERDGDTMNKQGERKGGRIKYDLSGYSCAQCGKPATEVKRFNVKHRRCEPCMLKYYAELRKEARKEIEKTMAPRSGFYDGSRSLSSIDVRDLAGNTEECKVGGGLPKVYPGMTVKETPGGSGDIEFRFCPGCGVDLGKEGSVVRTQHGHVDDGIFVWDDEKGVYGCAACSMEIQ